MVAIRRDCRRQGATKNLRGIELGVSRVASGYKDSSDGITGSACKATFAGLIKPRILMQKGRENCSHHKVLYRAVGSGRAIALGIGDPTLPVSRLAVVCLINGGK